MRCFLAQFAPDTPCDGRLIRAHLLPKNLMRRHAPNGLVRIQGKWTPQFDLLDAANAKDCDRRYITHIVNDPRCWVWACGGICGNSGHHGQLDASRTLRIPRECLPAGLEQFAEELGLVWFLERTYGPLPEERAA